MKYYLKAQKRIKTKADKHRTELELLPRDLVFVKLQPYKWISIIGDYHKLSKWFYGPYKVLKRIEVSAYQIELPAHSRIHNIVHVSCLKQAHGSVIPALDLHPTVFGNSPLLVPLCVLDTWVIM